MQTSTKLMFNTHQNVSLGLCLNLRKTPIGFPTTELTIIVVSWVFVTLHAQMYHDNLLKVSNVHVITALKKQQQQQQRQDLV